MQRRSVVITDIEKVEILEEEFDELKINFNDCYIETIVSMISPGTELSRVFGLKKGVSYPIRPGYCSVGKIIKKGPGVKELEVNDLVLFSAPHSSHHILSYSTQRTDYIYKIDSGLSPNEGAILAMAWIAMNGILPIDVKIFDTTVIFGLGTIGILLAILYKKMGVNVIGVDLEKNRCRLANALGVDNIVDVAAEDQVNKIMPMTYQQKGANIVVDASGLSPVIEKAVAVVARNGYLVLLGSPREDYTSNITPMLNQIHMKNLRIIGALNQLFPFEEKEGSSIYIRRGLDYLTKLMLDGTIKANKLISHIVNPTEIMTAYHGLMNKKNEYTNVIIEWKTQ